MKVAEFDYELPEELIAQRPAEPRDSSRMMVLHRENGLLEHRVFRDIISYLHPGDALVMNNTKVLPARLFGVKDTGARVEVLLLKRLALDRWEVLVRPGKKVHPGDRLDFGAGQLRAEVLAYTDAGGRVLEFSYQGAFEEVLDRLGQMPLPPYIREQLDDPSRYQTVYAVHPGSAAAPTAGLHFTPRLLQEIREKGVRLCYLLLHVGLGTFRPVQVEEVEEHRMHSEYYQVPETVAEQLNLVRMNGGRVVAVGTTAVRTLETVVDASGIFHPGSGWTDIFIYPGYLFRGVDAMVTNFHLPRSTLMMLISALASPDHIQEAYRQAVENRYRFFSFGDAMLII